MSTTTGTTASKSGWHSWLKDNVPQAKSFSLSNIRVLVDANTSGLGKIIDAATCDTITDTLVPNILVIVPTS